MEAPRVSLSKAVTTDTLHTRDTLIIRDSVATERKGDTIYVTRVRETTRAAATYKAKADTLIRRDTITVVKAVPQQPAGRGRAYATAAFCGAAVMTALGAVLYKLSR